MQQNKSNEIETTWASLRKPKVTNGAALLWAMFAGFLTGIATGVNYGLENVWGMLATQAVMLAVAYFLCIRFGFMRESEHAKRAWWGSRAAKDDSAVSPVIGVILMVAITVVLAAVVFILVTNLAGTDDPAPSVSFSLSGDTLTVIAAPQNLVWGDFAVTGCTTVPADATGFAAGTEATGCTDPTVVHEATNTLVYQS